MKASTNGEVNRKVHEVKGEANEKLWKPTNDPTLEGKDENKVGRVQRKIGRTEKALEKYNKVHRGPGITVSKCENFEHSTGRRQSHTRCPKPSARAER